MPNENQRRIGQYTILQTLGKGGFSKVKLGVDGNGEKVALKLLKKDALSMDANTRKQVEREIEALSKIQHPNVLRLKEVMFDAEYPKKNGNKDRKMLIVLELATGGELFDFLSFTGCFEESVARTFFHQLVDGLSACHEKGIAHRDLKPENLLLDNQFRLKIADFGFATAFGANTKMALTECGTPGYMSPEMFSNSRGYDPSASDIWASGVILFIMLAGFPPFQRPHMSDWWFNKLSTGKHHLFWEAHCRSAYFSDSVKDLLNKLLTPDASKRIGLDAIKKHPWYLGNTLTPAAVLNEFSRRFEKVNKEKQRERLEHEKQKAAQKPDHSAALSDEVFRALGDESHGSYDADEVPDADDDSLPSFVPSSLLFNVDTQMFKQQHKTQQEEEQTETQSQSQSEPQPSSSLSFSSLESSLADLSLSNAAPHHLVRGKSIPVGRCDANSEAEFKFSSPPPALDETLLTHSQFKLRTALPSSPSDADLISAGTKITHRLVQALEAIHADFTVKPEEWKIKATLGTSKGTVSIALHIHSQKGEFAVVASKLQGDGSAFRQAYVQLLLNLEDLIIV